MIDLSLKSDLIRCIVLLYYNNDSERFKLNFKLQIALNLVYNQSYNTNYKQKIVSKRFKPKTFFQ
jgi:hypothetical protein